MILFLSSCLCSSWLNYACSLPLYPSFWLFFLNCLFSSTFATFSKSNTLFLFLIIMTIIIFGFRALWRRLWWGISVRAYWMNFGLYQVSLSWLFSFWLFGLGGIELGRNIYFISFFVEDQRDRDSWQPSTSLGISLCCQWGVLASPSFFLARHASFLQRAIGATMRFLDRDWQLAQSWLLRSLFPHSLLIEYLLGLVLISWNYEALDHRCTRRFVVGCAPDATRSYQSRFVSTVGILAQVCWWSFDSPTVAAAWTSILFRVLLGWRGWPRFSICRFWPLLTFGGVKRFKMHFGAAINSIAILESTTWSCTPLKLAWRREWTRSHLQCTLQLASPFLPPMSFMTGWSISPFQYFCPQRGQVLARKSLGALSTALASTSRARLPVTTPTMWTLMIVACVLVFSLRLLVPLLYRSQIRLIDIQIQERFITCDYSIFLTSYFSSFFWFTLFQW